MGVRPPQDEDGTDAGLFDIVKKNRAAARNNNADRRVRAGWLSVRPACRRPEPVASTPDECAAQFRTEAARWTKVIRDAGIKAQ